MLWNIHESSCYHLRYISHEKTLAQGSDKLRPVYKIIYWGRLKIEDHGRISVKKEEDISVI